MNSPVMFPYATSIVLDKASATPVYLQLGMQLITWIKSGRLAPGTRLPSSRAMSGYLKLHRNTIIAAYDELMSQGWIEVMPSKGTYVSIALPVMKQRDFCSTPLEEDLKIKSGFPFQTRPHLHRNAVVHDAKTIFLDEGVPDNRLAPIEELAKGYRDLVKKEYNRTYFSYGSIYGSLELRKTLVTYLKETRGLQVDIANIMITRGSQMGIYLATQLLLKGGGTLIIGETNYCSVDQTAIEAGGKLVRIPVDEQGLVTAAIAEFCKKQALQAVYVTSHHHHPTTVPLSAQRRMHLLSLAKTYKFAIIEDDYDYDFHYDNAPIMPLASHDTSNNVVYTGALCKIVAPAIRIGYLVASKVFIDEAARLRAVIDRQGDIPMEMAISRMIVAGAIQRHSKKALRIYRKRRVLCCALLQEHLATYFDFKVPEGGMAIWLKLAKHYH